MAQSSIKFTSMEIDTAESPHSTAEIVLTHFEKVSPQISWDKSSDHDSYQIPPLHHPSHTLSLRHVDLVLNYHAVHAIVCLEVMHHLPVLPLRC